MAVIILKFYNYSGKLIHRIVLFLKFAPVFGRILIVHLWNGKNNKTSVDGQTLQSLWI